MNQMGPEKFIEIPWTDVFLKCQENSDLLPAVLAHYSLTKEKLTALAQKSYKRSEAYGRKILFKNDRIEVMVADWSYQSMASPHNHGQSKGLIWFAKGDFYEQHFSFKNKNLVTDQDPIFYKENTVVHVNPGDIHSCQPDTTGVSLHIYSPPIHKMKVWDQKQKRTLTVADHCGAWVPDDQELILEESLW